MFSKEAIDNLIFNFFEGKFNLQIKNINHYYKAITHKSYFSDCIRKDEVIQNYDGYEFFGDSLLNLIISIFLYDDKKTSGIMTQIRQQVVQSKSLIFESKKIGLNRLIRVGPSIKGDIPESIIEDVYESTLAAIYFDNDFETVKQFVFNTLWKSYVNNELDFAIDFKTILQNLAYSKYKKNVNYKYQHIKKEENQKDEFFVTCEIDGICSVIENGEKIRDLEKKCAKSLLMSFFNFKK